MLHRAGTDPVLINHRRAMWYALGLLAACVLALAAVGRHPLGTPPTVTTVPFIGHFDASVYRWMDDIRVAPLTLLFRFLNVAGGGLVTIPLRAAVSVYLLARRYWRKATAFILTWIVSEVALTTLKAYFHRGRPPMPLVIVKGASFPSGHAVAGAAVAVGIVLAFFPAGERRRWEWAAAGFAFVMAFSRVYLNAHWFSDVVAGVLLGTGIAIGAAVLVTEIRDVALRRQGVTVAEQLEEDPEAAAPPA
jgi:membrane-associated phospholipid phosphatase